MDERQKRRFVFVLGAGASYGAGAAAIGQGGSEIPIPTQNSFWEVFLKFCRSPQNRKTIEAFLFRYFHEYAKVPSRLTASKRRKLLNQANVEEVFTFLSERNSAPGVSPQLRTYTRQVWDALLSEIGNVFGRFPPSQKTRSVYRALYDNHVRSHDTIVSFNYDIVFEYSLPQRVNWYYPQIDTWHDAYALRVLKPHGSINWVRDGEDISVATSGLPEQPVVVAPTHLKFVGAAPSTGQAAANYVGYLDQSEQISNIWRAMEKEFAEAKAWIFVGYSFPTADLYFSSVLRSVLAVRDDNPLIILVNPDAMAIRDHIAKRFTIPRDGIIAYMDLQSFCQVTRQDILKRF